MKTKTRGATIAKPYSQAFGASFQKKILKSEHWHTDKGYGGRKTF